MAFLGWYSEDFVCTVVKQCVSRRATSATWLWLDLTFPPCRSPTEEGRAHAAVHPGSQHHHAEPLRFRTPKEAETQASKSKDEVTMEEVGQTTQLRAGELIIIVVVLIMWAGVIALFCRQYDIIKDNEPNNNKDKAKNSSECSTPEHPTGGLLRSKV
uniref:Fibronectin type III domain containing 5 n=1 Tax=Myripristis murdjan TaxID=586833 RepID=A0A667ZWW4_9TELE